jgi:hypothetical protein
MGPPIATLIFSLRPSRALRSSGRAHRIVGVLILTCLSALQVAAQSGAPALTPIETAVACAAPLTTDRSPLNAPRIIGGQDTTSRALFGPRDLLVIGGGTRAGVQLGQQFFVRRANHFGAPSDRRWQGIRTLGWIRVVAVNDSTAIAMIDHVCDAIAQWDYLEPFTAPVVPVDVDRDVATGDPDFTAIGRVMAGIEDRQTAGAGDFVLIDRGSDHGVKPGARYAVYRDIGSAGMPLAAIGEAVVLTAGKTMALTRITRARDAVLSGDYVAPRR